MPDNVLILTYRFVREERPHWCFHFAHPMDNLSVKYFNVECDSIPGAVKW